MSWQRNLILGSNSHLVFFPILNVCSYVFCFSLENLDLFPRFAICIDVKLDIVIVMIVGGKKRPLFWKINHKIFARFCISEINSPHINVFSRSKHINLKNLAADFAETFKKLIFELLISDNFFSCRFLQPRCD